MYTIKITYPIYWPDCLLRHHTQSGAWSIYLLKQKVCLICMYTIKITYPIYWPDCSLQHHTQSGAWNIYLLKKWYV